MWECGGEAEGTGCGGEGQRVPVKKDEREKPSSPQGQPAGPLTMMSRVAA